MGGDVAAAHRRPAAGVRAAARALCARTRVGALAALTLALLPGTSRAQGPRSEPPHALRVGGLFPIAALADGAVRASYGSVISFGLVGLPRHGPVSRLLLDGAPAVLRVDPDRNQCPLGSDCTPDTSYGIVLAGAVEAGIRRPVGENLVAYATLGPAAKVYGIRDPGECAALDVSCVAAGRYTGPKGGAGAHASVGIQPPGAGRHLSAETGAWYTTYPHARPQLDLAVAFSFRF